MCDLRVSIFVTLCQVILLQKIRRLQHLPTGECDRMANVHLEAVLHNVRLLARQGPPKRPECAQVLSIKYNQGWLLHHDPAIQTKRWKMGILDTRFETHHREMHGWLSAQPLLEDHCTRPQCKAHRVNDEHWDLLPRWWECHLCHPQISVDVFARQGPAPSDALPSQPRILPSGGLHIPRHASHHTWPSVEIALS